MSKKREKRKGIINSLITEGFSWAQATAVVWAIEGFMPSKKKKDKRLKAINAADAARYVLKMRTGPRYNDAYGQAAYKRDDHVTEMNNALRDIVENAAEKFINPNPRDPQAPQAFTHRADDATELYESEMDRLIDKHLAAKKIRAKDKYHLQKGDYVAIEKIPLEEYQALYNIIRRAGYDTFSEDSGRFGWKYMGIDMSGGLRHWNTTTAYGSNGTERSREYILGATPKEVI